MIVDRQARKSYERLLPRLRNRFAYAAPDAWEQFETRLELYFERLFKVLLDLYQDQYDFFYHFEMILETAAKMWLSRPVELKILDNDRANDPQWFQAQRMVGGVCYVDLFAEDLSGLRSRLPYLRELGITYLHLMPLFRSPDRDNDGGYAVSNYREVAPRLGTMKQLALLATELRHNGISLVIDFIYNHTADSHEWAQRAIAGEEDYQEYYFIFPDRTMPDAYQAHLRDIFPEIRKGSFTYRPDMDSWVWTTFQSYQWDLNYRNPAVFNQMLEEMLFLANVGVEVLRLDAVAFTWKELGTSCENLPQAHWLIQAFNLLVRIAAPSMIFKSEAIVHPDDVVKYIDPFECQTSYNPLLMAVLWEALATRDVGLLQASTQRRQKIHPLCAWVNYIRSHDDIGWTFSDDDAYSLDINAFDHRQFLNRFYTGQFEGSFARGLPFQFNPVNMDMRISGTTASLTGLERAIQMDDEREIDLAIKRILLIYSVAMSIGGIPLIYLGDEVGTVNDYEGYRSDPYKVVDSRWVHRPTTDWEKVERRNEEGTVEHRLFTQMRQIIQLRKDNVAFAGTTEVLVTDNGQVFGYVRQYEDERILVFANFTEEPQELRANKLRMHGLGYGFFDLISHNTYSSEQNLRLEPYQFVWLKAVR